MRTPLPEAGKLDPRQDTVLGFIKLLGDKQRAIKMEMGIFNFTVNHLKRTEVDMAWTSKWSSDLLHLYVSKVDEILMMLRDPEKITQIKQTPLDRVIVKWVNFSTFIRQEEQFTTEDQNIKDRLRKLEYRRGVKIHKCKCGANDTSVKEVQTRSADEPATLFITCNQCGNKWSMKAA